MMADILYRTWMLRCAVCFVFLNFHVFFFHQSIVTARGRLAAGGTLGLGRSEGPLEFVRAASVHREAGRALVRGVLAVATETVSFAPELGALDVATVLLVGCVCFLLWNVLASQQAGTSHGIALFGTNLRLPGPCSTSPANVFVVLECQAHKGRRFCVVVAGRRKAFVERALANSVDAVICGGSGTP